MLIVTRQDDEDPTYELFLRESQNPDNQFLLIDKNIDIVKGEGPFKIVLKDYNGEVILELDSFTKDSFQEIKETIIEAEDFNKRNLSRSLVDASYRTYKQKYAKYKSKYLKLKTRE